MTEQEISNKCKSLDASNDTFKNIIKDCKNPKFNNLDSPNNWKKGYKTRHGKDYI